MNDYENIESIKASLKQIGTWVVNVNARLSALESKVGRGEGGATPEHRQADVTGAVAASPSPGPTDDEMQQRYEEVAASDWFRRTYTGKSLGEPSPTPPDACSPGRHAFLEKLNAGKEASGGDA